MFFTARPIIEKLIVKCDSGIAVYDTDIDQISKFIYDNKELECYIAGESIKELKESFYEDIVVSWKLYVECDISELDSGAIELRNNLERLLVRVQ